MKFTKLLYGMLFATCIFATACSSDDDGGPVADGITGKYTINYNDYSGPVTNNVDIEKVSESAIRLHIENLKYNDYTFGDINAVCSIETENDNTYFDGEFNTTITRATDNAECEISGYINNGSLYLEIEVHSEDFGVIDISFNGTLQEENNNDNNESADLSTSILGVWQMTHNGGFPVPNYYIIKLTILASGNFTEYTYIPDDVEAGYETTDSGTWRLEGNKLLLTYNDGFWVKTCNIVEIKNNIMTTYAPGDEGEPGIYAKFKKVNLFN